MKIAIMQPYLFPYVGYFQLINAVDTFVIYDDVNYINKGWINRNNILVNGKANLFTISLKDASQNKLINEIELLFSEVEKNKLLKTLNMSYKKTPFFEPVYQIFENQLNFKSNNISDFNLFGIKQVCDYLQIKTTLRPTSSSYNNSELSGEERIIDICNKESANIYINPIGGRDIYTPDKFLNSKIQLYFIKSNNINYKQFKNEFVPWLSIIDVMMFNSVEEIQLMLNQFELIL